MASRHMSSDAKAPSPANRRSAACRVFPSLPEARSAATARATTVGIPAEENVSIRQNSGYAI